MSEKTPNAPPAYRRLALPSNPSYTEIPDRAPRPYSMSKATSDDPPPYRDPDLPSTPDITQIFIVVMGVTGSGKSSFIRHYVGDKGIKVGHGLESCTKDIQMHSYMHSTSIKVNLIDTPGFDDDSRTDADVLEEISGWLYQSYTEKIKLNGLLYLHRITDTRMQGSSIKNLAVFKSLCGLDALKHVTLVTTMWDKDSCHETFEDREKELLKNDRFWATMIQRHGACKGRHNNTRQSAMHLLEKFIQQPGSNVITDLQRELVDDKLRLDETAAGKVVMSGINKAAERLEKELRRNKEAREDLASAAREEKAAHKIEPEAQWAELQAEKAEIEAKLRKLKEQEEKLRKAEMESSERWNRYFRIGCVLAVGSGAVVAAVASGAPAAVPTILKGTMLFAHAVM